MIVLSLLLLLCLVVLVRLMLLHVVVIILFVAIGGKIGVVIRTNKGRRWDGSVLVEKIVIVDKA